MDISTLALLCFFRCGRQCLVEPLGHDGTDLRIVLLQHHHVAVAVDADIGELDPGGMDAGLLKVLDGAMIVRRVIGRLRRQDQNRQLLEIRERARRRLLPPASDEVRPIGLVLMLEDEILRLRDRR